jgi:hypothetical protein
MIIILWNHGRFSTYLLSLTFIRYPERAEQKLTEIKRPARSFLYNQPADILIRARPTLQPASAVFDIEEPLSIFNMEDLQVLSIE